MPNDNAMYPIRFQPIFKDYLWGGQRLSQVLGKETGSGVWAESWEIADHDNGQSRVRGGHFAGMTLRELLSQHGSEIVGVDSFKAISNPTIPDHLRGRFPLLLKFLDANQVLSVQVHPDDKMAARLQPPDLGKTEAWYVMDAKPNAKIYAGLKSGVTRSELQSAIESGHTESVLNSFTAKTGNCIFIQAGTIHAIGAGLLVCEIQQSSDTTFRLHDWNRVNADGQARPLHVEQGVLATDFGLGPVAPQTATTSVDYPRREQLVSCEKFVLNRWRTDQPEKIGGDGRFHILAMLNGEVSVEFDACDEPLRMGQSILIPAGCPRLAVTPNGPSSFLHVHLP